MIVFLRVYAYFYFVIGSMTIFIYYNGYCYNCIYFSVCIFAMSCFSTYHLYEQLFLGGLTKLYIYMLFY